MRSLFDDAQKQFLERKKNESKSMDVDDGEENNNGKDDVLWKPGQSQELH